MPSDTRSTPAPVISVVVPTRDRSSRLANLIGALRAQTLEAGRFELIVVDDGSRDDTPFVLANASADAPFHVTSLRGDGEGPAAARNLGWAHARADLVAFTDDDCEPDAEWLRVLLRRAGGAAGGFVQGRTRPIEREGWAGSPRSRTKSIDGPGPWFQTCNIAYPKVLLERLDGFDESFERPFGEDADLAWRAISAGAHPHFEPDALVYHAVENLSVAEYLASARRDPDEALIFRRHRELRRAVARFGIFKSDHHAFFLLAVAGLVIGRHHSLGYGLWGPYLVNLVRRTRRAPLGPLEAPVVAAHDAIELTYAARGAARHRIPFV